MTIGVCRCDEIPERINKNVYDSNGSGKDGFYAWNINASLLTGDYDSNDQKKIYQSRRYSDQRCKTGDLVEMVLDLDERRLSYLKNDKSQRIAFENIKATGYKAVVFMNQKDDSIEIVSYKYD